MTSKKHMLHVFPSFGAGGVPIRITAVMNYFGDRCRHTVIALDGNADAADRIDPGVEVKILHPEISKKHPVRTLSAIAGHLRKLEPDVLLTFNWGAAEWALVNRFTTRIRHIHFESGFGPEEAVRQKRRRVLFRRSALHRAERIIVPSENLVRIVRDIWRLDPEKIQLIPNGVDCVRYGAAPDPAALPDFEPAGATVIGTVAPLREEKNIGWLINAFARVADQGNARLLIVGDGPTRGALEALAKASPAADRIYFAGYMGQPEKVFGLMDVFAMSSDTEQMPNALLQAMAAGRPVVSTDVGDIRPIVSAANRSYVFPVGDAAGYDRGLGAMIADKDLRDRLGAANRQRVVDIYSMEKMLAAYEALLLR
ncbi:MAG: glycosyltransferase involved in cell wall biosynthesis [Paracoccaceae bacterium]|jgi:glycosyltransferase involved in cell wall biosynthesis